MISSLIDIDYSRESQHTPKDTALETASFRVALTLSEEMMVLRPGDWCSGDFDVEDGKEEEVVVTMPFHCDARLERSMHPILGLAFLNNRMMRKK